jgi:hypothetical protein
MANDPKPIEYELEDHDAKPPESEAEALARLQREDEERARQMGLVKPKHSTTAGRRWQDGIGGNSANAAAARMLQQEAMAAERKRAARAAGLKLMVGTVVVLALAAGGAAVALDYMGAVKLGIFSAKPAPVEAQPAVAAVTLAPTASPVAPAAPVAATPSQPKPKPITVLGVVGEATPIDNPPTDPPPGPTVRGPESAADPASPVETVEDKRARERAERKLASAQRGVAAVEKDLAEKRAAIATNLRALWGFVPSPRDEDPPRRDWVHPCAMIEAEAARRAPKTEANAAAWKIRVDNADAAVRNLRTYLASDRKVEKEIEVRLAKAKKAEAEAQAALAP